MMVYSKDDTLQGLVGSDDSIFSPYRMLSPLASQSQPICDCSGCDATPEVKYSQPNSVCVQMQVYSSRLCFSLLQSVCLCAAVSMTGIPPMH